MEASVTGFTATKDMKIRAWVTVGMVLPTFIVPGMRRSSTSLRNLKMAVCWAKLPTPSASNILVTKPVPRSQAQGAGERSFLFL